MLQLPLHTGERGSLCLGSCIGWELVQCLLATLQQLFSLGESTRCMACLPGAVLAVRCDAACTPLSFESADLEVGIQHVLCVCNSIMMLLWQHREYNRFC
jgi:hypothetical protein